MNDTQIVFDDVWTKLHKKAQALSSTVTVSALAAELVKSYDYNATGVTSFTPFEMPELPNDFKLGVIVGASGSGKSTLLKDFGETQAHAWTDKAICDHFDSPKQAEDLLFAVGLTSIPTWLKPYAVLSNGEKFRADLALSLKDRAVIDEYTSVVDRNIAIAASKSLAHYVESAGLKGIVIATCHRDVIPFLKPDWIIDTDAGAYCVNPKECLRPSPMVADVYEVTAEIWELFAQHHYLQSDLSPFAKCFVAIVNNAPAAFYAIISYPSGTVRNAFRGHRLVTLPDYQGLGLGTRFADYIANAYVLQGKRFFAKTAHPRLGEYRERSNEWRPTSKNKKYRTDTIAADERLKREQRFVSWTLNPNRYTYSHEFIGAKGNEPRKI